MFTQCRGCGEIFALVVDDLVTASAMVRCSSCGTVFSSLDTLSAYKPQANADLILHENDNPPPLLTHEFKQSVVRESFVSAGKVESNDEANDNNTEDKDAEENIQENMEYEELDDASIFSVKPDFVAEIEPKKSHKPSLYWSLSTIGLVGLLLWQVSSAIKNGSLQLADGEFKNKVCAQIECFKGMKHANLNKIALVSRSIRQHPGRDNALIITTGIINSDENTQAFPALQIKMSNLNGEIVAMRRFLPNEYVNAETIAAGMLPNTLIPVTLELQSPGNNAVAFEVGFSPTFGAQ